MCFQLFNPFDPCLSLLGINELTFLGTFSMNQEAGVMWHLQDTHAHMHELSHPGLLAGTARERVIFAPECDFLFA